MNIRKTAFITGSTRSIGFACANMLASLGFNVIINGRKDECTDFERLKDYFESTYQIQCLCAAGDVSDLSVQDEIITKIKEQFSYIDCFVNNAGVSVKQRDDILNVTEESYDFCNNTNARALFFLNQKVSKWMLSEDKDACIINITSCSARALSIDRAEYCISKAAASMASQLFALRLADTNIRVYEIRPGIIDTDMTSVVIDKYKRMAQTGQIPQKRVGTVEDVAALVKVLALNRMPYIVGQIFDIDGGLHFHRF